MSYYFPQATIKLGILFEDFNISSVAVGANTTPITVQARNLSLHYNDFRTADTFTCEIDYKNFPFDPRSIRACSVRIYMDDMESLVDESGEYQKLIPTVNNLRFAGFVDQNTISFDDNRRTVKLEGRDFTCLLTDQKYYLTAAIDDNKPLDVAIQGFFNSIPALKGVKIINRTVPLISPLPNAGGFMPQSSSAMAAIRNPGPNSTYWDIIQDKIRRCGLIGYFHFDTFVITTPRNQNDETLDLKFIYGKNIKNVSFNRKIGRLKNFNLILRSVNDKDVLDVHIPRDASPVWGARYGIPVGADLFQPLITPSGTTDQNAVQPAPAHTFNIPKIANQAALISLGQTLFEEFSFEQLDGSLTTHEMLVHRGVNKTDSDYEELSSTEIEVGMSIAIDIDGTDLDNISRLQSTAQRVKYLKLRGYSDEIATLFATTLGKMKPRFLIKDFSLDLSQESGFKMMINFINIIDIRNKGLESAGSSRVQSIVNTAGPQLPQASYNTFQDILNAQEAVK